MLERRVRPVVGDRAVPLAAAHGRILAETVVSERDVPGFDNVAVDGFAFAHGDLAPDRPTRLRLLEGRAAAGHPFDGAPAARRGDPGPDRRAAAGRCRYRADAGGRRAGGRCRRHPARREARRQPAPGRRGHPRGPGGAAGGPASAPAGRRRRREPWAGRARGLPAAPGRLVLDRRRAASNRVPPLAPGATYDANRTILQGLLGALGCSGHRPRHPARSGEGAVRAGPGAGGRSARCGDHLGRRLAR